MQIKKLKEIATITMGQSPSSETYNTEGIGLPFFQGKKEFGEKYPTVEKYCSAPIKVAESGDILMSVRAPVGPTNVANCKCCIGRGLCAIRIDENVGNQSYLLLFFKSFEHNILALRKGSTFDAIGKTDLENLQIPLPPLSTQKAIVAKLDTTFASLDQAITSTQKNLNHLDELKKSILNDTFNINNIYIYIKNSQVKLGEVVDILDNMRRPISTEEREKRNLGKTQLFPYYGATRQNGWIDNYIFDEELVLLGEDGADFLNSNVDKAYIINGKTRVNNHAHVLRGKENIINNKFLCCFLNIFDYHGYVSGATRLKLNQSAMKEIQIPLPSLEHQQKIVAHLDETFTHLNQLKSAYEQKLTHLQELKASVLAEAFT